MRRIPGKHDCVGVGAAWKERDGWQTRTASLGKCLTGTDATAFAIGMVLKDLPPMTGGTKREKGQWGIAECEEGMHHNSDRKVGGF